MGENRVCVGEGEGREFLEIKQMMSVRNVFKESLVRMSILHYVCMIETLPVLRSLS